MCVACCNFFFECHNDITQMCAQMMCCVDVVAKDVVIWRNKLMYVFFNVQRRKRVPVTITVGSVSFLQLLAQK